MEQIFAKGAFALYTLCILGGGLAAAAAPSLVRALLGLIVTMFGVAGMYLLLAAPFVAMMQLLVYVGAVAVLVFFAIMMAPDPLHSVRWPSAPMRKYVWGLLAASGPALILAWAWLTSVPPSLQVPAETAMADLGKGLMEDYLVAFELISVVLFVAMSAAVLMAFKPYRSRPVLEKEGEAADA